MIKTKEGDLKTEKLGSRMEYKHPHADFDMYTSCNDLSFVRNSLCNLKTSIPFKASTSSRFENARPTDSNAIFISI